MQCAENIKTNEKQTELKVFLTNKISFFHINCSKKFTQSNNTNDEKRVIWYKVKSLTKTFKRFKFNSVCLFKFVPRINCFLDFAQIIIS